MFAGHIGAALAIGRAERGVNVGLFIAAALLLDIVLWILVLLGWESVAIPADFSATHQADFVFPYSHGLVASVAWAGIAGVLGWIRADDRAARLRLAALLVAAVFSHWVLDALVHKPELPITGSASQTVGLGGWDSMPLALALEAAIVTLGLWLFLQGSALSRRKSLGLAALVVITLVFTIVGMTVAPPPPSPRAMAASSLATIALVCLLACWLGRLPKEKPEVSKRQPGRASPILPSTIDDSGRNRT
jgi:hypothetical protein